MSKSSLACLVGSLLFVAGCFPVELDVNGNSELLVARQEGFFVYDPASHKASMLLAAKGERPVFARFAPDGRQALLVTNTRSIDEYRFAVMNLPGSTPRTIYTGRNTALALFSPDGKYLAVSRVAEKERKNAANINEILLIDLANDITTTLLEETLFSFRWFNDSKRLALFKIEDTNEGAMTGYVVEFDIATKKEKRLATASVTGQTMCIELRPDQQTIVFSAANAGKPGANLDGLEKHAGLGTPLWLWNAKDGSVTKIDDHAEYARFSPKGDRLLLARMDRTGQGELRIANADGRGAKKLIDGVTLSINRDVMLPGWLNDDTVYYFTTRHTYGAGEKALALITIRTDGKNQKSIQAALDHAVRQIVKNLPEPDPNSDIGVLNDPAPVPEKKAVERAQSNRGWTATVFSTDGLVVFAATTLIVVVLAVFLIRRVRRPTKNPETPA